MIIRHQFNDNEIGKFLPIDGFPDPWKLPYSPLYGSKVDFPDTHAGFKSCNVGNFFAFGCPLHFKMADRKIRLEQEIPRFSLLLFFFSKRSLCQDARLLFFRGSSQGQKQSCSLAMYEEEDSLPALQIDNGVLVV